MDAIAQLLRLAERYCAATGLAEATVSSRCFTDGKRLAALRGGSEIGARRLGRALEWFSANWPDGADWPGDIPRPEPRPLPPKPANDDAPTAREEAA
jgi:hypothetical protein